MSFCFKLVDELGHNVLIKGLRFVKIVPLIQTTDELVAANCDQIRGSVGDREVANSTVVELNQGRSSSQMTKFRGHDRDHMGGIGIDVSSVLGRDGGGGERTNGSLSGGHQLVLDIRNGEDLLCLGA